MKLKIKKIDIRKQQQKVILCITITVISFLTMWTLGKTPITVAFFFVTLICIIEFVWAFIALIIGFYQERRQKCAKNEL